VGQGRQPPDHDAPLGQFPGEVAGIRVARLADRQLRPDREELGGPDRGHRGRVVEPLLPSKTPRTPGGGVDDRSTNRPEAPKPAGRPDPEPRGLRAQLAATFTAGKRLFRAHVDLAKSEMSEI